VPELPEVETTRRGIEPLLIRQKLTEVIVRDHRLRWPVKLPDELVGQTLGSVTRRGKYLLFHFDSGTLILHLGMSGSLRCLPKQSPLRKHDHVELLFEGGTSMRFNDPRRFGCVLWQSGDAADHPLLTKLGVEPLEANFTASYLKNCAGKRQVAVKSFLMNAQVVVGVGNIYANESLFLARIRPTIAAGAVSLVGYQRLVDAVVMVLKDAIKAGGTTLQDFAQVDGNPGYFANELHVYGRAGEACSVCGAALVEIRLQARTTVFCRKCQPSRGIGRTFA